jgi:hypothetical protein
LDPFTIALAAFGVQKLRGKSTNRALRDALIAGSLGQAGAMAGVGGLQGFGTVGSTLQGGTLGAQFMNTAPVRGIGALFGKTPATQAVPSSVTGMEAVTKGASIPATSTGTYGATQTGTGGNIFSRAYEGFKGLPTAAKVGIGAAAIPLLGNFFGGDDKETTYLPTPNMAYGKFAKSGLPGSPTGFYTKDYDTGTTSPIADPSSYRTVEEVLGDQPTQGFKAVELNEGGLASIARFNEGGQVLPSKYTHDENDINNYQRANGFVMDGTGNGKDHEDTMLAQLADGEFVSRSHAVLGAGIIAGASIRDKKEQREKGAKFFYEQQKRFKRIFDIVNANKTEH